MHANIIKLYRMKNLIEDIYDTIKDYRNDDGIYINKDHIQEWANQFWDDAEFVLKEFVHIDGFLLYGNKIETTYAPDITLEDL